MSEMHKVVGEEKDAYLNKLDLALQSLIKYLKTEKTPDQLKEVQVFGNDNNWNWSRLPKLNDTYKHFTNLVQLVRKEFSWFGWKYSKNPEQNMGYFTQLDIQENSGMPHPFSLVTLENLQEDADNKLSKLPSFKDLDEMLRETAMSDELSDARMRKQIAKIHSQAMNRNFFERLKKEGILGWGINKDYITARKIIPQGVEDLWNVQMLRYSIRTGIFHVYIIDMWQDRKEPYLRMEGEKVVISNQLKDRLHFPEENAAWYILSSIDEEFPSLHPVHVTRGLIGPFECKYMTSPDMIKPLPITRKLLKQDPEAALLRASVQYSFAPNYVATPKGDDIRQVVYQEDWRDEIIVCPGKYAQMVSTSLKGDRVRIFEY